uniref:Uncharacterized protein n=1 Tax=Ralstonia solanacearum TaxID=305 RepID=A0A0S4XCB9_RALSL|nr:protein of unknown function [Ralstonia solanacearum]CUV60958.1 protein of unknown function [Ralstonia solanacearum]
MLFLQALDFRPRTDLWWSDLGNGERTRRAGPKGNGA